MKRKNLVLSIFALLLIACAVITPTVAYFTANAEADGSIPVSFQYKTEIREDFDYKDWLKSVQIGNIKNPVPDKPEILSDPIWVRARAYSGETYPLVEAPAVAGDWKKQGEWWVYQKPLAAGELTTPITFQITGIPDKDDPDHQFTSFNVGVVYESTLVRYNADGSLKAPDWSILLDTSGQP